MSAQTLLEMLENDLEMTQEVFSTVNIPCPAGVWDATVSGMGKGKAISRRAGIAKTSGDPYFMLNITFKIEEQEVCEECKQDAVYVSKGIMLRIVEDECVNMDAEEADQQLWVLPKAGNTDFGKFMRWAEGTGYSRPKGWARFWLELNDSLVGKTCKVEVTHKNVVTDELDSEGVPIMVVRANVNSIGAD
jgi:hypothetical protein